jgi:N-acetylneuraminic acid mutarotase
MKPKGIARKLQRNFTSALATLILIGLLGLAGRSIAVEDTWTQKADMPTPRLGLAVSAVNGMLYAIGGMDLGGNNWISLSVVEEYDPKTDKWVRKQDMPTSRWSLGTSAVNGKIYAIGGGTNGALYRIVEEYDPSSDTWERKADMPTARDGFSTCVVNGVIYAIGGWLLGGGLSATAVEAYDPKTDTWTRKANMLTGRQGLATVVVDSKIYAIGGLSKGTLILDVNPKDILSSVEEYNPVTDTWTEKSNMPEKRAGLATCAINGRIYVFGGVDGDVALTSTVYEYNPKTDEWIKRSDMQVPRESLSADTVDGKIYAVGGFSILAGIGILSTVEEYTPVNLSVSPKGKLSMSWGELKKKTGKRDRDWKP